MRKYLLTMLALILWSNLAFGQANALIFQQRNANDNGVVTRTASPPANVSGYFYLDGASKIPRWGTFGVNCVAPLGVINCPGVQSDWNAVSGPEFILNKPTNFPTTLGLISDSTSFGRSWMELSGVPAAKSLLDIPSNTSELTNDSGFLTAAPVASVNGKIGSVVITLSDVGAAAASHDHSAIQITTGVLDSARIPSLPTSKIFGLDAALALSFVASPPFVRTFGLATAYQCTNAARPCVLNVTLQAESSENAVGAEQNNGFIYLGDSGSVASGSGVAVQAFKNSVGIGAIQANGYTVVIPIGYYVAVRQTEGTGLQVLSAYEQSL